MTSDDSADDLVTLEFLKGVAQRLPEDADVLRAIGDLYTRVGQYERGLETDQTLVRLCPEDSMVWYNLGCSLALVNRRGEALEALAKAVQLGYCDHGWMEQDADLRSLRNDQQFKDLLKRIAAPHTAC